MEARRLQAKYKDVITLLVGMEIDWIRDSSHKWIISLLTRQQLDIFVGSVHHVHGVPIDYNGELYAQALNKSSLRDLPLDLSAEEILFVEYFDTQLEMLHALKPPIVGHFDLIRLKSTDPNMSLKSCPIVWDKILRNLHFIVEYGGVIEINTAAWKKGLEDAYPNREICSVRAG